MKIAYEPHPVSAARKAELRAAGYKIIDAKFAPVGAVKEAHKAEAPVMEQVAKVKFYDIQVMQYSLFQEPLL